MDKRTLTASHFAYRRQLPTFGKTKTSLRTVHRRRDSPTIFGSGNRSAGVRLALSQDPMHVLDAAFGLGGCRNRATQDLEVQLGQAQFVFELLQHPAAVVVGADEAVPWRSCASAHQ